jgi:hypothetical protein
MEVLNAKAQRKSLHYCSDYCIDQFGCFMMDLEKMSIYFLDQMRVNDFKIENKTLKI